jgi:hypothetical protein
LGPADNNHMEIKPSQLATEVGTAVVQNVMSQMKSQGASVVELIAAAGSTNLPGQGGNVDARA